MPFMTVLKVSPMEKPEVITIPHNLDQMQYLVGGSIQAIYPFEETVALVCNEEGKLHGLQPNRAVRDPDTGDILDIICGPFFVCGLSSDDFGSLNQEQIQFYTKLFQSPEMFLWNGNRLVVLKIA